MTCPAHRVGDNRACGAQTLPGGAAGSQVFMNNIIPAVVGDTDTHTNLGALINVLPHNVKIGGMDAIPALVSSAAPDQLGLIQHILGLPLPIQGSQNIFIGSGTNGSGIGMLGSLGGLNIGELVSVAGQVVGMVQNFINIGGGAGVAQLSNLQGLPLSPGTTVTGVTSNNKFTFANYFDSRTYNNVPGAASYGSANAYPSLETFTATANVILNQVGAEYDYIVTEDFLDVYVMDDGSLIALDYIDPTSEYILIDDYFTLYPTLNLTSSTIVAT